MTVLVTGGAGYIGSHMVHALADAGESVVVIDNLSTGFSAFLPEGVPLFIGDAGDENLVEGVIAQHGVESIIHFAGSVVVPDSMRDPLAYYRNNTMTTRSLLNAAVKGGISRFIFSSTAAVYGNPDQVPVPEHAPTRPLSPYGSSKLMTEIMLHDTASAHGMSYAVLRYFNVAGADPQARMGLATVGATHLLKIAVEAATAQRAKIDVFGTDYPTPDGSCIRDFIHVSDLAQAHRAALALVHVMRVVAVAERFDELVDDVRVRGGRAPGVVRPAADHDPGQAGEHHAARVEAAPLEVDLEEERRVEVPDLRARDVDRVFGGRALAGEKQRVAHALLPRLVSFGRALE